MNTKILSMENKSLSIVNKGFSAIKIRLRHKIGLA